MNAEKPTITFTLLYRGEEYRVHTYRNQYYSLMTLVAAYLGVPGFGLCSGMGSCGTCLIGIAGSLTGIRRMTLSCDIRIDDELANMVIFIPETAY